MSWKSSSPSNCSWGRARESSIALGNTLVRDKKSEALIFCHAAPYSLVEAFTIHPYQKYASWQNTAEDVAVLAAPRLYPLAGIAARSQAQAVTDRENLDQKQ